MDNGGRIVGRRRLVRGSHGRACDVLDRRPGHHGRSAITVAYRLYAYPGDRVSPNRHAGVLHLDPSTISTAVRRQAEAGLVDESEPAVAPDPFWALAVVWRAERTWLLLRPDPRQYVPTDSLAPSSWRMTGTAAAAAYGAPLTAAGEGPLDLYVTDPVELSIACRRYGAAAPGAGPAVIAVPPHRLGHRAPGGRHPSHDPEMARSRRSWRSQVTAFAEETARHVEIVVVILASGLVVGGLTYVLDPHMDLPAQEITHRDHYNEESWRGDDCRRVVVAVELE